MKNCVDTPSSGASFIVTLASTPTSSRSSSFGLNVNCNVIERFFLASVFGSRILSDTLRNALLMRSFTAPPHKLSIDKSFVIFASL